MQISYRDTNGVQVILTEHHQDIALVLGAMTIDRLTLVTITSRKYMLPIIGTRSTLLRCLGGQSIYDLFEVANG